MDAVFRAGIDTPFFLSTFNDVEMGSKAESPIVIDEEPHKANSPLFEHLQSPRDKPNHMCSWEVAPLEQNLRMFPILFKESCLN